MIRAPADPPAPGGYRVVQRLEFSDYDSPSSILEQIIGQVPAEFSIIPIDTHLFDRCEWRDEMVFYCGSKENFLRNAMGLCLMCGDEIVVEAYASALGLKYAEVGAITHEPYRGKGFATVAVAHLIRALGLQGYHPYWSCDVENPSSTRVARKLGFSRERSYEIWEYPPEII